MLATYDVTLVIFSFLVAILASYTALKMTERIAFERAHASFLWLIGGAIAMGIGIWSMHFIGMLAFRLPIALGYDVFLTVLSLLIAIAASGFALWSVSREALPLIRLLNGALWMGIGIALMHYMGMSALMMSPGIQYDPFWFIASIVVAFGASLAALWLAFQLRKSSPHVKLIRFVASIVMGFAIVGIHYIGMKAATFQAGSICLAASEGMSPDWLAILVLVITVAVLTIALLTALLVTRHEAHTAKLARANQELKELVLYDHLTKLPNRSLMEDRLSQAIRKSLRNTVPFALMYFDLDEFKEVNDTLGHHAGDLLLVEVAGTLSRALRAEDTVARMGGDEFVVIADATTRHAAVTLAKKLLSIISQPIVIEGKTLHITASIGIAMHPWDGITAQQLMVNADSAMYWTKRNGRNGYQFYTSSRLVEDEAEEQAE